MQFYIILFQFKVQHLEIEFQIKGSSSQFRRNKLWEYWIFSKYKKNWLFKSRHECYLLKLLFWSILNELQRLLSYGSMFASQLK